MSIAAIADLVEAHRAAMMADEANFDADGKCLDDTAAEASAAIELKAYRALVEAPCRSAGDVQAKINYILNGSVGVRSTLLDCLIEYGDDLTECLIRSLVVEG